VLHFQSANAVPQGRGGAAVPTTGVEIEKFKAMGRGSCHLDIELMIRN
jgi:hypothetical protein